ncbi:PIG-L deacetylase family protein [Laceyella putida]|uniref:PIG-L deacetylase family protein n=1 Tax=Laceyella putida TaxID=110101 RepID=A0ABW2RGK7_9BACL
MNQSYRKISLRLKLFAAFSILTLSLLGCSLVSVVSAENTPQKIVDTSTPKPKPVAIYLVPHADDELLAMGADIVNHQRMGYEIQLVLASPGEHSGARFVINGFREVWQGKKKVKNPVFCRWHNTYHSADELNDPDHYVDTKEFGEARIREFYEVARRLGVPKENTHTYDLVNGHFTEEGLRAIYDEYLSRYPHAIFRTLSPYDYHPDHAMMGKVLMEYEKEGKIKPTDTAYFLSIYKSRFTKYGQLAVKLLKVGPMTKEDGERLQHAAEVYSLWEPQQGWWALGYHSVPQQFDSYFQDKTMVMHY